MNAQNMPLDSVFATSSYISPRYLLPLSVALWPSCVAFWQSQRSSGFTLSITFPRSHRQYPIVPAEGNSARRLTYLINMPSASLQPHQSISHAFFKYCCTYPPSGFMACSAFNSKTHRKFSAWWVSNLCITREER